jgi:type IV pilus biogenesis protein CpaD/CtpE
VTVFHVLDPAERDLAIAKSEAELIDTETSQSLLAMVSEVREAYRQTVQVAIGEWRDRLAASGTAYEVVLTDQPFGVALRRAFAARQHLP